MDDVIHRRKLPKRPIPGLTICYSYLWHREAAEMRREEGLKYRPCVIVLSYEGIKGLPGRFVADVAPVTHRRPDDGDGVEIPLSVKRRMGLDAEHSWVVTTEINRFIWPRPDLHPVKFPGNTEEPIWHWGIMATDVFLSVRNEVIDHRAKQSLHVVPRMG